MQAQRFAGAPFVFVEGMEATQVRIVEAGAEVVLAEIGVVSLTAIEVRSWKDEGRRMKEIAVGIVTEGIGDVALQVGQSPDATASVELLDDLRKPTNSLATQITKSTKGYGFGTENRFLCVLCALCGKDSSSSLP